MQISVANAIIKNKIKNTINDMKSLATSHFLIKRIKVIKLILKLTRKNP